MSGSFRLLEINPYADALTFQISAALLRYSRQSIRLMNRYPFDPPHSLRLTFSFYKVSASWAFGSHLKQNVLILGKPFALLARLID
jgi:hypothetical protein